MEMHANNKENSRPFSHSDDKTFAFFYDSAGYKVFWKGLSRLLAWGHRPTEPLDDELNEETENDLS